MSTTTNSPPAASTLELRVMMISAVVLLHLVVMALVAVTAVVTVGSLEAPPAPHQPFLLMTVALLMAHCSLNGIWWARVEWPSHAKTLAAVLSCVALWGLLLLVLPESRHDATRAAGWAASFASQFVVAALLAISTELAVGWRRTQPRSRYSILYLFIWTSLIGCLLGAGRLLARRFGWTAANFFAWNYFWQLQTLAAANAIFAVSILACLRVPKKWYSRCAAAVAMGVIMPGLTALIMYLVFDKNVGIRLTDLVWLSAMQGLFLTATLVPLEVVHGSRMAGQASAHSAGTPTHISK